MDALAFLAKPPTKIGPLYVLHGDEPYLKRQVLVALRSRALGADATDQSVTVLPGDKTTFADVFDELDTVPFFEPRRVVLIDNADPFVTRWRADLEKKIDHLPATGVLILDVKAWAATTRLAKMVDGSATIVCKPPTSNRLGPWCVEWAASRYEKKLTSGAASLLVDHVGADMGLLDQELLKLSIYVGKKAQIEPADVDTLVGNNRAEVVWKIFDALAVGKTEDAMAILQRLLQQGEEPMRLMGAFSSQIRKLAQAARLIRHGASVPMALETAGVLSFAMRTAEQHMRRLGRARLDRLYDMLLEIYMDMRGDSALPIRTLLERFVLKLARND